MTDHWSLRYGDVEMEFTDDSGIFLRSYPELSAPDGATDDIDMPRDDGLLMGIDTIGGQTLGMSFGVQGATADEAQARWGALRTLWRADVVRSTPGAVAELRSDRGRSAFGRPRRLVPSSVLLTDTPPTVNLEADFRAVNDLWYGSEQSTQVPLVPAPGGGLVAPLAAPLSTTASSSRATSFEVGGEVPTDGVFTVSGGQITNPVIEVVGVVSFQFDLSLAYDQTLVVDTRPWARSIRRNGGSVRGALARGSSRLSSAKIPPGEHQLVLRGSSLTGTPNVSLSWRDAFTTY